MISTRSTALKSFSSVQSPQTQVSTEARGQQLSHRKLEVGRDKREDGRADYLAEKIEPADAVPQVSGVSACRAARMAFRATARLGAMVLKLTP